MAIPVKLNALPYSVVLHDKAHSLWLVVWPDLTGTGGYTGTLELRYSMLGRLENFDPAVYQEVMVRGMTAAGTYSAEVKMHGIPLRGSFRVDRFEVEVANIEAADTVEANRVAGNLLVGQYKTQVTYPTGELGKGDWLLWTITTPDVQTHTTRPTLLEVCASSTTNPVYPGGVWCVEYERNADGSVKLDSRGVPKVATSGTGTPGLVDNLKIAPLVLSFQTDYFATGKHAWIGQGGGGGREPFDIILTAQASPSTNYDLTIWPGVLNQVLPTNILATTVYNPATTVYVKLVCVSDGKSMTSSSIVIDATPPVVTTTIKNQAPLSHEILIGLVVTGTLYQEWQGNIQATPTQVMITERSTPAVGASIYDRWWNWTIAAI